MIKRVTIHFELSRGSTAGDLLHALDDAYNRGDLPDDASWTPRAPRDLIEQAIPAHGTCHGDTRKWLIDRVVAALEGRDPDELDEDAHTEPGA